MSVPAPSLSSPSANFPVIDAATREAQKDQFLASIHYADATRSLLAGDASFRKYDRVLKDGVATVLMDAPPPVEDIRPFAHVAKYLSSIGLSAPRILGEHAEHGFLLLEDLGDDSYTKLLKREPAREQELYLEAGALLAALHAPDVPQPTGIPPYDFAKLQQESDLMVEWYMRAVRGPAIATKALAAWRDAWGRILSALPPLPEVLVLRDYHADNLMWLPDREGVKRVGLLDFQDALMGSPAYDLVSVLEDARRDVATETVEAVLANYVARTGMDNAKLRLHYAVLGAQRNAKIIGIFMRLTLRDKKPHYLSYLPRVWSHMRHDISHPALAEIAAWVAEYLPGEYQTTPPLEVLSSRFNGEQA